MSPLRMDILRIIEANDGKFGWYHLDRALTNRAGGVDPGIVSKDLMPALHELEQDGLIARCEGVQPGQYLYSMTPAGRQLLKTQRA